MLISKSKIIVRSVLVLTLSLAVQAAVHAAPIMWEGPIFPAGFPGDRLTATFEFATPITDGATLTHNDVTSFSAQIDGEDFNSSNFLFFEASFTFDDTLLPTDWMWTIEGTRFNNGMASPDLLRAQMLSQSGTFRRDFYGANDLMPNSPNWTSSIGPSSFVVLPLNPQSGWSSVTATVPEPSTLTLLGIGVAALLTSRRRKRESAS